MNSEWWQPADSQLPLVYQQLRVSPVHHIPFSELTAWRIETKKKRATYFIYVSKVRWKEGRKEGAGRITLSVGWYLSIHADQFSQTEGDEKGASARKEGGREGRRAEMVVVLICQRNTALSVLLKRPHKPELSEVGGHILTFGHTDIDCGFSARFSCTRSHLSTSCGNRQRGRCLLKTVLWRILCIHSFKSSTSRSFN